MKKLMFCVTTLLAAVFASCSNFETSDNGSIDGFWQMVQVDSLSNGHSMDVRERLIFWSIQAKVIELSDRHTDEKYGLRNEPVFFSFEYTGDSLKLLSEPRPIVNNRRISDRYADTQDVTYYGVELQGESFRVLRLEKQNMTLQSDNRRIHFRKF